ncbi:hypothetical protein MaudCBS49596_007551 [Microsporum audouinii]
MASQAALIDETIVGLKRALLRHTSDAAYDDAINQPSNRGNKTRLNAEFVREGALGYMNHAQFYRKKAEHSGYQRDILENNPPRYDAEGDELDFDDSDAAADADATDDNPFSSTHLDDLLSPLTHPSELANHSMANAYTNKAITIMVERINRRLRLERHALWQAKNVYRQLVTDSVWVPCGAVESDDDPGLFGMSPSTTDNASTSALYTSQPMASSGGFTTHPPAPKPTGESAPSLDQDILGTKVEQLGSNNGNTPADKNSNNARIGGLPQASSNPQDLDGDAMMQSADANEGEINDEDGLQANRKGESTGHRSDDDQADARSQLESSSKDKVMSDDGFLHPRRMTTRAQVSASQNINSHDRINGEQLPSNALTNENNVALEVDPVFKLPRIAAHEERNCGLSQSEADETRRMLWAYIQKQGESVRLFTEMLKMLRKSHRMKEEVWEWCKAEAHIGEMSDGEDWYDKERWGLAEGEDLRKGADEEETEGLDEGRPTGKRGRGRRA